MATTTLTPGVYIEEVPVIPASIAPVATAIPAFVGYTETALIDGVQWDYDNDGPAPAIRVTSILEYQQIFGGAKKERFDISITDTPTSPFPPVSRTIDIDFYAGSPSAYILFYSLQLYFANGGGPCYIVSVGDYGDSLSTSDFDGGVDSLEKYDEPTLIVMPDAIGLANVANYGTVIKNALDICAKMQDRFVIADVYGNSIVSTDIEDYREELGINNLKYGATYMPYLNTLINFGVAGGDPTTTGSVITYSGSDPAIPSGVFLDTLKTTYPSLYEQIIAKINNEFFVTLPPSSAMAGIYAKVDRERGVWKAPANVSVNLVTGPTINITNAQQETLNVDASTGKSINAIRSFTGKGTIVWGSRTLAGNDNEWRYVPVRRLFIFVEESIEKATEFVVFEPNTANTWQKVRGMIEAFLTSLWRDGALAGATTQEAFFVRVGLGTTMTPQDILEGRMIVEVGLAAVRPAEFIVLKFMHKLQES